MGRAERRGRDGGSRTYSRHTTTLCFIHRFETNSKRVLFVACFLFVTDNVVVLLLSELSGLYLPVQGCIWNYIRARREISSLRRFCLFFSSLFFFFLSFFFALSNQEGIFFINHAISRVMKFLLLLFRNIVWDWVM